jgi:hypothetical protein
MAYVADMLLSPTLFDRYLQLEGIAEADMVSAIHI